MAGAGTNGPSVMPSVMNERGLCRLNSFCMRTPRIAFAIVLLAYTTRATSVAQIPLSDDEPLHAVHNALFASFLPIGELPHDPQTVALLTHARDALWSSRSGTLDSILMPFADLRGFGAACGMQSFLAPLAKTSFDSLTAPERARALVMLASCDQNDLRHLAMGVRNFYIANTYGAIQEALTGIHLNLFASHDWIAHHTPALPHSRLRYNSSNREIVSTDRPFDYVVVGSGPAGSVLAHELRRGGKHVLLIERGSLLVPGSMQTRSIGELIDARTSEDGGIFIHNGLAVGGGTEVNVDLCFAPTLLAIQRKIEGWRRAGQIRANEFSQEEIRSTYEWVKTAIGTRTLTKSEINANNHVLWDGSLKAGLHPKLYDLNTYAPGTSPYPTTDKRSSESQLLIDALQDRSNPLSILPDADVRRILFEPRNGTPDAVGIELVTRVPFQNEGAIADPNGLHIDPAATVILHAQTVILAAGALGSPTILLRSGLTNDQIGRGVVLHPSLPILAKFDRPIDALNGTQASVFVDDHLVDRGYAFESMSAEPSYAALMALGPPLHTFEVAKSFRNLAGFGVMLVDTVSPENRLLLDSKGEPVIQYQLSSSDKQRFRQGIAEAVRTMFLAGAREVYIPSNEDLAANSPGSHSAPTMMTDSKDASQIENLQFIPNRTILTSAHMQATDKMGNDPRTSVVAPDFHVWGTTNLYVMDGSVFPTSVGANPMQTIYTFAKIFADQLQADRDSHANQ